MAEHSMCKCGHSWIHHGPADGYGTDICFQPTCGCIAFHAEPAAPEAQSHPSLLREPALVSSKPAEKRDVRLVCGNGHEIDVEHLEAFERAALRESAPPAPPAVADTVFMIRGVQFIPKSELTRAESELAALREEVERVKGQLSEMQSHRDTWREYAYGNRNKPQDFLDGNKVGRGPTQIERLREEVEKLRSALKRIKNRWEKEDKRAGNRGFDERRSPLAWAMWSDAEAALREGQKG